MNKLYKKLTVLFMIMMSMIMILTACGSSTSDSQMPAASSETAAVSDTDSNTVKEKLPDEHTQIPDNGIVTADTLSLIAGQEGIWYFEGTSDGITYEWAYDGSKIKNPEDQKLGLSFTGDTDEICKAADNAPYGLGITIDEFNLASPVTLTLVLDKKWDADRALYCIYEDGTLYQLSDVTISSEDTDSGEVTKLVFTVNKTGGTFYIVAGSTASDETVATDNTRTSEDQTAAGSSDEQTEQNGSQEKSCKISISCSAILDHMDELESSKAEFVPANGMILGSTTVAFEDGDTVFDVLKAVCKDAGIQMESEYTPAYGSYYVSGINQLYEFDCGETSGWMYKVNGWAPNYGSSEYKVEDGDVISWEYTCSLGSDLN